MEEFRSRVYTDRPPYADFPAPQKFEAIKGIIARRLKEHPKAVCSYSGGSDSDILIHLIEQVRSIYNLPEVDYIFFNTGLEMEATKRHVRETAEKYGVEIKTVRPRKNIIQATREYGQPFISKAISQGLNCVQQKLIPFEIVDEYAAAQDKTIKYRELRDRYPNSSIGINCLCSCDSHGTPQHSQMGINSSVYLIDFIRENPIPFNVSSRCCNICKKEPARKIEKCYEMEITGERRAEGGIRSVPNRGNRSCFEELANFSYRLKPLYYVTKGDKSWYKEYYGIRYSDAYEVYGLKRTGCCGCAISARATQDLELIRPYEPNVVKAAWNIFGDSYRYREKYNEYRAMRNAQAKAEKDGQIHINTEDEE